MDLPLPISQADTTSPCAISLPSRQSAPIVLASPHSGRDYSAAFIAASRLDPLSLRRSEDSYVEDLLADAPSLGIPLLTATFPRAYCDVNREAWELDPGMFSDPLPAWVNTTSPRVQAGLGTIAKIVASGEAIYRRKLRFADAEARVRTCWQPYHDALGALIATTTEQFGACLLIDCHSMPGLANAAGRQAAPDFVIGDAHGTSCAPAVTGLISKALGGFGYSVKLNDPYAGGYVTRHYGRPREGVHVVQIEVARGLYMDEPSFTKRPSFAVVKGQFSTLLGALIAGSERLLG